MELTDLQAKTEATAEDLARLAEASERVNEAWQSFDASRKALLGSVRETAPAMVATYDVWRVAAAEFLAVATQFSLAEGRRIEEVMRVADRDMKFFRDLAESVQEAEWPAEVEET